MSVWKGSPTAIAALLLIACGCASNDDEFYKKATGPEGTPVTIWRSRSSGEYHYYDSAGTHTVKNPDKPLNDLDAMGDR